MREGAGIAAKGGIHPSPRDGRICSANAQGVEALGGEVYEEQRSAWAADHARMGKRGARMVGEGTEEWGAGAGGRIADDG